MGCVCCVCIESEMEGIVIAEEAVDNALLKPGLSVATEQKVGLRFYQTDPLR